MKIVLLVIVIFLSSCATTKDLRKVEEKCNQYDEKINELESNLHQLGYHYLLHLKKFHQYRQFVE